MGQQQKPTGHELLLQRSLSLNVGWIQETHEDHKHIVIKYTQK